MTREWLDGPKFAAWVHEAAKSDLHSTRPVGRRRGDDMPDRPPGLENLDRYLGKWKREGCAISIYTADRYLTQLDLHIDLIPEECWRDQPFRRNGIPMGHPKVMA